MLWLGRSVSPGGTRVCRLADDVSSETKALAQDPVVAALDAVLALLPIDPNEPAWTLRALVLCARLLRTEPERVMDEDAFICLGDELDYLLYGYGNERGDPEVAPE